jgi:hypothetical protein
MLRPASRNPTPAVLLLDKPSVGRDQQFGAFRISEVVVKTYGLRYTPGVLQFALGPVQPLVSLLYSYINVWNNFSDAISESCQVDPVSFSLSHTARVSRRVRRVIVCCRWTPSPKRAALLG